MRDIEFNEDEVYKIYISYDARKGGYMYDAYLVRKKKIRKPPPNSKECINGECRDMYNIYVHMYVYTYQGLKYIYT